MAAVEDELGEDAHEAVGILSLTKKKKNNIVSMFKMRESIWKITICFILLRHL